MLRVPSPRLTEAERGARYMLGENLVEDKEKWKRARPPE